MFRFLSRVLGILLLAFGAVGAVIDGTRSIANSALLWTPLGDVFLGLFPRTFPLLEQNLVGRGLGFLWSPILVNLLLLPACLIGLLLGTLLLWLGQKPLDEIGYAIER